MGAAAIVYASSSSGSLALHGNADIPVQFADGADPDGNNVHANNTGFSANATLPTVSSATKRPIAITVVPTTDYELRLVRESSSGTADWDDIRVRIEDSSGATTQFSVTDGVVADAPTWVAFTGGEDGSIVVAGMQGPNLTTDATFQYRLELRPLGSTSLLVTYYDLTTVAHRGL